MTDTLARLAYTASLAAHLGQPPRWEQLPPQAQLGWEYAVSAVVEARRQQHEAILRAAALRVLEAHGTGEGLEAALLALGTALREGEAHG